MMGGFNHHSPLSSSAVLRMLSEPQMGMIFMMDYDGGL
jgi:hypothetical protein